MSRGVLALTGPAGGPQDDQVLVDALPYLDVDYNESDRQLAHMLIEQECKIFRPTKNYLKHLAVPDFDMFLTPSMLKEHARMAKKQDMQKLDMSRCEIPSPAGTSRANDRDAWKKSIKNAKTQNEHLVLRQINLELMNDYAAESYLRRNKELEKELTKSETILRKHKEQIMEVHAHRKRSQMDAGRLLKEKEQNWVSMVSNNYRMEMAINELTKTTTEDAKRLKLDENHFAKK
ncbi:unnamed protein product [Auanema sp. JU1783]|nr:unnamed protein product [Auanema sp. JU1783]